MNDSASVASLARAAALLLELEAVGGTTAFEAVVAGAREAGRHLLDALVAAGAPSRPTGSRWPPRCRSAR